MATVRDIALQADCSIATVSLVFQGDRRISEATANRVRSTANRLGYKYIPKTIPAFTGSKQRHFALVTSALTNNPMGVYVAVIDGIADTCRELGVRFSLHQVKTSECMRALSITEYDAIIYGMANAEIENAMIEGNKKPIVKVMGTPKVPWPYDHVTYNNSMVGRIVGDYFIKQGHRRVVVGAYDDVMGTERIAGVCEAIEKNGGKVDVLLWPEGTSSKEMNKFTKDFLARLREDKVTAIFSSADIYTVNIYQILLCQGFRPGRDIEVVSCNNESILDQLDPRPLSVDIHGRSIGRMAVRQLLWRLENPREPVITLQMSPSLPGIDIN
ncbi:MAG: LacI family DNA-binding transcriptional regulator [Lentisphaerota bacterium]